MLWKVCVGFSVRVFFLSLFPRSQERVCAFSFIICCALSLRSIFAIRIDTAPFHRVIISHLFSGGSRVLGCSLHEHNFNWTEESGGHDNKKTGYRKYEKLRTTLSLSSTSRAVRVLQCAPSASPFPNYIMHFKISFPALFFLSALKHKFTLRGGQLGLVISQRACGNLFARRWHIIQIEWQLSIWTRACEIVL